MAKWAVPAMALEVDTSTPFGTYPPSPFARAGWWLATARFMSSDRRRRVRRWLKRHHGGPFDCTVNGLRMRLYPTENHSDRTIVGRGLLPEEDERKLIAPYLLDGMSFVDIGANIGVYTLFVAHQTRGSARILALEPHPETFRKLVFNVGLNGFDTIACRNVGAGPDRQSAMLHFDGGGNIGSVSLVAEVVNSRMTVPIEIVPLADTLSQAGIGRIDLLKIDIEGYEDRALIPFFETVTPGLWPGAVLVETVHHTVWQRDLVAFLGRSGYEIAGQTAENLLMRQSA